MTGTPVLRVEGKLSGPSIGELGRIAEEVLAKSPALQLDLAGVTFADSEGVAFLKGLEDRRCSIRGCSSFIAELIWGGDR
jgi:ABC-type transporter Mla MlaB component